MGGLARLRIFSYGGWGVCVGGWVVFECCVGVGGVVGYIVRVHAFLPCGVYDCRVWFEVFW